MIKIFVAQLGWVFVGRDGGREGDHLIIEDCRCIRVWGTEDKGGLGYLANHGPTKTTILEDPTRSTIHVIGLVITHDCDQKAWAKTFTK